MRRIGRSLFCLSKLVTWMALIGPILVREIPKCYYRGPEMETEKRWLTFDKMHHAGNEPPAFNIKSNYPNR